MGRSRLILLVVVAALAEPCGAVEHPAIRSAIDPACASILGKGEVREALVAVRDLTKIDWTWRARAAIQSAFTNALFEGGWQTRDAEVFPELAYLAHGNRPISRTEIARWAKLGRSEQLVVVQMNRRRDKLNLRISLYSPGSAKVIHSATVELTPKHVALGSNASAANQQVASFVKRHLGQPIGDGECSTAAYQALSNAGLKRFGTYVFGRRLADHEALLPGDILEFESAKFVDPKSQASISMGHHTAIVEEVLAPHAVHILHQNYSGKRTISRLTLNLDHYQSGTIIGYRPSTDGKNPRTFLPIRKEAVKVMKGRDGQIDLLQVIDPKVDTNRGIWFREDKAITCNHERLGSLQVPVDLPDSYVLRATLTRLSAPDAFVFGVVVGGQPCNVVIDGYGGGTTGILRVNGKKANDNSTTYKGPLLPRGLDVKIEIQVSSNSIAMTANDRPIFSWKGNVAELSQDELWQVPRRDWLYLGTYNANVRVSSFTLEPR